MKNEVFYPAVVLKNAEMEFNFGETDFKHKIPDNYIALCRADSSNVKTNPNAQASSSEEMKSKPNAPKAIIIEPSRELAEQTFQQLEKFKKYLKDPSIREYLLIGGQSSKEQINELQKGVDVRLSKFYQSNCVSYYFQLLDYCCNTRSFGRLVISRFCSTYTLSIFCT